MKHAWIQEHNIHKFIYMGGSSYLIKAFFYDETDNNYNYNDDHPGLTPCTGQD